MSSHNHTIASHRPERSRNAKAQARHRAKRKAYIEQLEQTVTKLQIALGLTQEQMQALPPPLLRIRELEQENARLEQELEDTRRALSQRSDGKLSTANFAHSSAGQSSRAGRRVSGNEYMPSHELPRPVDGRTQLPTLSIPTGASYMYLGPGQSEQSSGLYSMREPAFQIPNTPSSTDSSPPFSPIASSPTLHRQHLAQLPDYGQKLRSTNDYSHKALHNYDEKQYVKMEEDAYSVGVVHSSTAMPYPNTYGQAGEAGWHSYSSSQPMPPQYKL